MRNMLPPELKKNSTILDFYIFIDCAKQVSLEKGEVIILMQKLYFWRKVNTNNFWSSKVVCNDRTTEVSCW